MARVMEDSAQNIPALISRMKKDDAADSQEGHVRGPEVDATLAARKQMVSQAQVDAVRARLSAEEGARCSDQTINQFLRATVCNIDQVLHALLPPSKHAAGSSSRAPTKSPSSMPGPCRQYCTSMCSSDV